MQGNIGNARAVSRHDESLDSRKEKVDIARRRKRHVTGYLVLKSAEPARLLALLAGYGRYETGQVEVTSHGEPRDDILQRPQFQIRKSLSQRNCRFVVGHRETITTRPDGVEVETTKAIVFRDRL